MSEASRFADAFLEEAGEILGRLEGLLVELERDPGNSEIVNQVFRGLHTLKGSGAMFGFDALSAFAHRFEDFFDLVRKGQMTASREVINLTLQACDHLRSLLDPAPSDQAATGRLVEALSKLTGSPTPGATATEKQPVSPSEKAGPKRHFLIQFKPGADFFRLGHNPLALFRELRTLGTLNVHGKVPTIKLSDLDPESCVFSWTLLLETDRDENALRDCFIFVQDLCSLSIEVADEALFAGENGGRIGEILVERGQLAAPELAGILRERKRLGEIAVEKGLVPPEAVADALTAQAALKEHRDRRRGEQERSTVRVRSERVDALVDLAGELVTLHSRFHQSAGKRQDGELRSLSEALGRLTDTLRESAMAMRMLPVEEQFRSFHRLVRDLSQELGKDAELILQGCETELDKNMLDALKDPLLHIIRNAVDHGLEMPEEREKAGKPRRGRITLTAAHVGAHVVITVRDDGGGLPTARIRAKALERGLIRPESTLSDGDIQALIFLPGFSTAERATAISGRGVGMDVVKRNVDKLRGSVQVASTPGKGTTFTLRLPLTLAIIDGLLTRLGEDVYILELSGVEECLDLTPEVRGPETGSQVVPLRGHLVPYVNLRDHFETPGRPPAIERMVVLKVGDRRMGVVVDDVLGQQQAVIKPLGSAFGSMEEVSGASILGDGSVALILDVNSLSRHILAQGETAQSGDGGPPRSGPLSSHPDKQDVFPGAFK